MTILKSTTIAALAAVAALATATAALAAPAAATGAVNVRTGPGTSYAKVDTLAKGEIVDVIQCQSGWCYIEHDGPDGWVSANYLGAVGNTPDKPDVNFQIGVGPGGIQFGFGVGDNSITFTPPAAPVPQICLHDGANYTGAKNCYPVGTVINSLPGFWNDRASSISVQAGATVTVCRHAGFAGVCQTYNSNKPTLPVLLNNNITAIEVY